MDITGQIIDISIPALIQFGYWILILVTLLESLPFCFVVPGHALVIISGFLAKLGVFNVWTLFLVTSIGVILGDLLGYTLGRWHGHSFIIKYGKYFFLREEFFLRIRKLLKNNTGKAVIIGRFNPFTRSFVPFLAGSSNIALHKFLIYSIIGGISWTGSSILIGYIFGQGYQLAEKYLQEFSIFIILLAVIIFLVYHYIIKRSSSKQK